MTVTYGSVHLPTAALGSPDRFERARIFADEIDDLYEDEYSLCARRSPAVSRIWRCRITASVAFGVMRCPNGESGGFCEHSIALGLCYLDEQAERQAW